MHAPEHDGALATADAKVEHRRDGVMLAPGQSWCEGVSARGRSVREV